MDVLYAYAAAVEAGPLPAEFATAPDVEFLDLGIGKAASAHSLSVRLAQSEKPDLVVLFGVAGAHEAAALVDGPLAVGDLCVVTTDCLADEGVQTESGFLDLTTLGLPARTEFTMHPEHTSRLTRILRAGPPLRGVRTVRGSTVSTCAGNDREAADRVRRTGAAIETMEGAAVAFVCAAMGVPLVQIRCVSNRTGNRDRGGWDLASACVTIQAAIRQVIDRGCSG